MTENIIIFSNLSLSLPFWAISCNNCPRAGFDFAAAACNNIRRVVMSWMEFRRYGYLDTNADNGKVKMQKGQNIAGYAVGILYNEDVWYPMLPGNVVNATTYNFPVRLKAVPGSTCDRLFAGDPTLYNSVLQAAKELEREGVRAISSACGFYGNWQARLAADLDIPVAISSLVQVPMVAAMLKPGQKIGVLTASKAGLTPALLDSCGIWNHDQLVVEDMYFAPEFSAIVQDRGEFDNGIVKEEILAAARRVLEANPDVGAFLLECSDMPPYASLIQQETQLPVFDFITLIKWLHSATAQRPYCGFI